MDLSFLDLDPDQQHPPDPSELDRRERTSRSAALPALQRAAALEIAGILGLDPSDVKVMVDPRSRTSRGSVPSHFQWQARVTIPGAGKLTVHARLVTCETFLWFAPASPDRRLVRVEVSATLPPRWFEHLFANEGQTVAISSPEHLHVALGRAQRARSTPGRPRL